MKFPESLSLEQQFKLHTLQQQVHPTQFRRFTGLLC